MAIQGDQEDAPLRAKALEAAEKFEAAFITDMFKQMRRSAREVGGEDSVFRDRASQDMLEMADQMTADALAGQHAFGIADLLLRQILPAPSAPSAAGKGPSEI